MRYLAALLMVAACEKSGPVETTPGVTEPTAGPVGPKPMVIDAAVATLPNDAEKIAVAEAAPKPLPKPANDIAMQEADALAIANMLTADDSQQGDMTARRPGSDLGTQIHDVRDSSKVAVGGGGRGGDARVGGVGESGAGIAPREPVDKGPSGRVSISKKQAFDDTSLTPDAVLAKMQSAYMAGIKRCYKNYLRKDPSARGKINLTFTVNETGRAMAPKAAGFAAEVDVCLSGIMAGWRFPIPKDKDGESTDAAFAFDLQLVTD